VARELRLFPITVAAGVQIAAPATTPMRFPPRVVEEVEVLVPPGPRGEVGWRIGSAGTQLLPLDLGSWIVTDNEVLHIPTEGFHDSGSWEFTAYNTGQFPHVITVRFLLRMAGAAGDAAAGVISSGGLGAVPGFGPSDLFPPAPELPALPLPALPALPDLIPPILPVLALPDQAPAARSWTPRAVSELAAEYGGRLRLFTIDTVGQLEIRTSGSRWAVERPSWARGLAPRGLLAGAQWGGLAHVFCPLQRGGILHLAQPDDGSAGASWGGEILPES
jgi:hypothetical protein